MHSKETINLDMEDVDNPYIDEWSDWTFADVNKFEVILDFKFIKIIIQKLTHCNEIDKV